MTDNAHSEEFDGRLNRWAARTLDVPLESIATVATEVVGGCWAGTCEYTIVEIVVTLTDGRRFEDERGFGRFLDDLLDAGLDEDGNETGRLYSAPLFRLTPSPAAPIGESK